MANAWKWLRHLLYAVMLVDACVHLYTWYPKLERFLTATTPSASKISKAVADAGAESVDAGEERALEKDPAREHAEATEHAGRTKECRTVWGEVTCRWVKTP